MRRQRTSAERASRSRALRAALGDVAIGRPSHGRRDRSIRASSLAGSIAGDPQRPTAHLPASTRDQEMLSRTSMPLPTGPLDPAPIPCRIDHGLRDGSPASQQRDQGMLRRRHKRAPTRPLASPLLAAAATSDGADAPAARRRVSPNVTYLAIRLVNGRASISGGLAPARRPPRATSLLHTARSAG